MATTTIQSNGTWSTGNAGTTPSTYNTVAGTSYYATAQNGSCSVSTNSATVTAATSTSSGRCGTVTGPVAANATTISGTLTGSFTTTTVNLYLDGALIGTITTTNTNWGPITVNSTINNTLYSNGVLTIGVQETGKQEVACPSSATTITCSPSPTGPIYTPTNSSISLNQTITYTISNAQSGTFYGIADSTTGQSYAAGAWATSNGTLIITTNAFTVPGSYNIVLKSTSLSGVSVCSSNSSRATLSVSGTLPLTLISFSGHLNNKAIDLSWVTENELNTSSYEIERSANGINFIPIGIVNAVNNGNYTYGFTDASILQGANYYRLKMIDIDGLFTYSRVIKINADNTTGWRIGPNPVINNLNIYRDASSPAIIRIYNVSGQKVFQRFINNNYVTINLSRLPAGLYSIQMVSKGDVVIGKIVKE